MARLNEDQLSVLRGRSPQHPYLSQRARTAMVRWLYNVTFEGHSVASIYAALRRVEKRVKTVVDNAITSANANADTTWSLSHVSHRPHSQFPPPAPVSFPAL